MRKILLIDCFDSFTYNLYHYFDELNGGHCRVVRYNELSLDQIPGFSHVIISPGPGLPAEYPDLFDVLEMTQQQEVLGVCLGLQAIVEYCGGQLKQLPVVKHGLSTKLIFEEGEKIYHSLNSPVEVGHYHSWVADDDSMPEDLRITGRNEEGYIMSVGHRKRRLTGVQFHPESILTPDGKTMLRNWLLN